MPEQHHALGKNKDYSVVQGVLLITRPSSMVPALKATVAHVAADPAWRTVRPPLVELTDDQQAAPLAELGARGFDMPGLQAAPAPAP